MPVDNQEERSRIKCYLCGLLDLSRLTIQLRNGPGVVLHCDACDIGMLQDKASDNLKEYYDGGYRKCYGSKVGEVVGVDYDSGAAEFAGRTCRCITFGCILERGWAYTGLI